MFVEDERVDAVVMEPSEDIRAHGDPFAITVPFSVTAAVVMAAAVTAAMAAEVTAAEVMAAAIMAAEVTAAEVTAAEIVAVAGQQPRPQLQLYRQVPDQPLLVVAIGV